MRCPTCRIDMTYSDERYFCPTCRGEFFPAEYFKRREDEQYRQLWELNQRLYYKALRDERETARVGRKYGYLRTMGREREAWEINMYLK